MSLSNEYRSEGAGKPDQPEVEEPDECPVCMDDIHSAVQTSCGHIFCGMCVSQLLETKSFFTMGISCPYCRGKVSSLTPLLPLTASEMKDLQADMVFYNAFHGDSFPWRLFVGQIPTILRRVVQWGFSVRGIADLFMLRILATVLFFAPSSIQAWAFPLDEPFLIMMIFVHATNILRGIQEDNRGDIDESGSEGNLNEHRQTEDNRREDQILEDNRDGLTENRGELEDDRRKHFHAS